VVTTQVVRELPVQKVVLREGFPFCDWLLLLECGNRQTDSSRVLIKQARAQQACKDVTLFFLPPDVVSNPSS
jgi:hypothetical protein